MDDRHDLDDLLRRHFDRASSAVELRDGSVRAAKRTARRRQYRRRRAGVAATAAAAVGVTGVGLGLLTRPEPQLSSGDADAPTEGSDPGTGLSTTAITRTEPMITWNVVRADSPEAAVSGSASAYSSAGPPSLPGVMVSTQPAAAGRENYQRVLWRSDDGVNWTQVGELPDGASAAATTNVGGRVYAVGTLPGERADSVVVRLSVSDDGGTNWQGIDLPIDSSATAAVPGVDGMNVGISSVAATTSSTLVLAREAAVIDDYEAAWRRVGVDPAVIMGTGPEGVDVVRCAVPADPPLQTTGEVGTGSTTPPIDLPTCEGDIDETERVTWASLGAEGEALRLASDPVERLFHSADGTTFTEVTSPAGGVGVEDFVQAVGDRLVYGSMASYEDPTMRLWESVDGVQWTELASPPFATRTLGASNGELVAAGYTNDGGLVIGQLAADGTWRAAALDDLMDGGDRVVLPAPGMVASSHGVTVGGLIQPTESIPPDETPGTAVDPTVTTVVSPTTTTIVGGTGAYPGGPAESVIMHSVDGVAWSVEHVAELLDLPPEAVGNITRVQQVGDTVVVAVNLVSASTDVPPEQVVLVGTPTA